MTKSTKLSIAVLTLGMNLALLPALLAQEAPGTATPQRPGMSDHHGMMGGDMGGMMKMMGQMSRMMEQCDRMMQGMSDRRQPTSPSQPHEMPSPNPGSKG